ncbi:MAG TPA: GntR family transcriptional regulator [Clostridiales bacterium]|nr:GntR family transcriptional regulator [Clostridiales bacterium]
MIIRIDFNSDEAYYIQLCNQIIYGIANDKIRDGDNLPSVRQMADNIGINMHTVNKAYTILKQEGYLKVDRRRGTIISVSPDKHEALDELFDDMRMLLAKAACKGVSLDEVHKLVEKIFGDFKKLEE